MAYITAEGRVAVSPAPALVVDDDEDPRSYFSYLCVPTPAFADWLWPIEEVAPVHVLGGRVRRRHAQEKIYRHALMFHLATCGHGILSSALSALLFLGTLIFSWSTEHHECSTICVLSRLCAGIGGVSSLVSGIFFISMPVYAFRRLRDMLRRYDERVHQVHVHHMNQIDEIIASVNDAMDERVFRGFSSSDDTSSEEEEEGNAPLPPLLLE